MTDGRDEDLVRRIRRELDASVDSLDGETRSRLSSARSMALETARVRNRRAWQQAGALVLASMLFIAVIVTRLQPPVPDDALPAALLEGGQDLELVGAIDSLELLEDLDFYYWLEEDLRNAG